MNAPHRAVAFVLLGVAISARARTAHAGAGAAFSETPRVASMADAVSALPGDAGSILVNPAGLSDSKAAMIVAGAHGDYVSQWFQRTGDSTSQDRSRGFGGFYFCASTPLPGPAWAHRIAIGVALDVPAQYLLHIDVPVRGDQPASPIYDGRPDRIAGAFALGYKIFPRVQLGAGFAISPSLTLPTYVRYVAGRSPNVNDNVEVRIDSALDLSAVPFLGLRVEPTDWLALSLVFRDEQSSHATGTQTTIAGGIVASDPIDFFQMWDPLSVVVGAAFVPSKRFALTLDVTWREWSSFRTGFDEELDPPYRFRDTVSIASGVEMRLLRGWTLRGGLGVEPTPIPTQTGPTNYLGANTFIAALGAGLDFRAISHLPMIVDAHVRARIDAVESATKTASALRDSDPTLPGNQIDNLGYPGFRSQALMVQAGLSATFFLGGVK